MQLKNSILDFADIYDIITNGKNTLSCPRAEWNSGRDNSLYSLVGKGAVMDNKKLTGYVKEFKFLKYIFEQSKENEGFEMRAENIDSIEIKPLDINVLEARHSMSSSLDDDNRQTDHRFRHFYRIDFGDGKFLRAISFSHVSMSIGRQLVDRYHGYCSPVGTTVANKVRYIVNLNEYRLEGEPHHIEIVIYKAKGFDFEKALRLISF